jgi:protein involved in polysaccharide export with SLBB domain
VMAVLLIVGLAAAGVGVTSNLANTRAAEEEMPTKSNNPKPKKAKVQEKAPNADKEHDQQGSDYASGLSPVTPSYVVEPPDILLLEVAGLPKECHVIDGEYLVRPDGTIALGAYGSVNVAGRSLRQLRAAIADHLAMHAGYAKLDVQVNVVGYNSKVFYVINKGKNSEVYRFPDTGGETVVGAILKVKGWAKNAIQGRVWLARGSGEALEVNWRAITQQGKSDTNYLLKSGDRVFIESPLPK